MKAAEILRLYEAGERDFRGVSLRGQNFKGKDLSGANFSEADIRSTNFTSANLTGVDFCRAQAGLQRRWAVVLVAVTSLLLSISGYFFLLGGIGVVPMIAGHWFVPISWVGLLTFVVTQIFLIRKGLAFGSFILLGSIFLYLIYLVNAFRDEDSFILAMDTLLNVVTAQDITDSRFLVYYSVGAILIIPLAVIVGTLMGSLASAFAVTVGGINALAVAFFSTAIVVGAGAIFLAVVEYSALFIVVATAFAIEMMLVSIIIGRRAVTGNSHNDWIRSLVVALAAMCGTSFRRAVLTDADFSQAWLQGTDFREATLIQTRWRKVARLHQARTGNTILANSSVRDLVVTLRGVGKSYVGFDLGGANLIGVDLNDADLTEANICQATLEAAWLERTNLTRTEALGTDFRRAKLTGACLESWNIDSTTQLNEVECKFVYLLNDQQERRPSSEENIFAPGEFTSLFEEVLNTVDLIFRDGVDWPAFFQAFQELRSQYSHEDFAIQAIEKKRNGAFIVRLEVSQSTNKALVESRAKELYETKLTLMDQRYRAELRAKDGEIVAYREQSANLMKITEMLAARPPMPEGNQYVFNQPQFGGGFADTVQGDQVGGPINTPNTETPFLSSFPSFTEAAAEIQNLLKPLEASNPTATEADQITFLNLMIPPIHRERFISALQSADSDGNDESNTALEDIPYGPLLKALVKSWQSPGSEE